ncbi:MAG: UTP--glucose-1-phosphate uridylyltransferase GalU [Burkholderiaceae bacterium]
MKVKKAVFPVAGLGTRFLPATKAMPKEMLPVVDKPLIQYAVEEAVAAGITELVFVTGRHKRAIEDHFDSAPELEAELAQKNKLDLLRTVRGILPKGVTCMYIRQPAALGLGHAVLCAAPAIGNEPFAVLLADDLIDAEVSVTKQLIDEFHLHQGSVIGVEDVPREDTDKYGIVAVTQINSLTSSVNTIVEKPAPSVAPSTLGVVGRYVLEPSIFDELRHIERGAGGEIQLTDAIAALMRSRPVFAHRYSGRRFDCGSKRGFWEATVVLGMRHADIGEYGHHAIRSVSEPILQAA